MSRYRAVWPLRPAGYLARLDILPYTITVLGTGVEVDADFADGPQRWVPRRVVERLQGAIGQPALHRQGVPWDGTGDNRLAQAGDDLQPPGLKSVDGMKMFHAEDTSVGYYGQQALRAGHGHPPTWRGPPEPAGRMEDADLVRVALVHYMQRHGLTPSRWCLDAGLSGRTLTHFLSGRSKSISPCSLTKLAQVRQQPVPDMLGFVPAYLAAAVAEVGSPAPGELQALVAAVLGTSREVAEALQGLRDELRAIKDDLAKPATRGRRHTDP